MKTSAPDTQEDWRKALRAFCAEFPPEYHRRHGAEGAFPEEPIGTLTRTGWLAALCPSVRYRAQVPRNTLHQVATISTDLIRRYVGEHNLGRPPLSKRT